METGQDTIAAIATPAGKGGIGIVRISGTKALEIAREIFRPIKSSFGFESHRLHLGHLIDPSSEEVMDEVLLSYMRGPYSYTREDVVEINSHSGYLLLSKILDTVIARGARLARPGEFTLRAFLNGRIDLTQAEAIVDLINSKSERGLHLATRQLKGALGEEIERLRRDVVDILSHLETGIDFPEEEAEIMSKGQARDRLYREIITPLKATIEHCDSQRMWVDGINTVITGKANAGKSSLLNLLLQEQRAIVTTIPGTTRDVIESSLTIKGLPLRLMDTAGFREIKDEVEKMGIDFTQQKLEEADFILAVIDRSRPLDQYDRHIVNNLQNKNALIVLNKIDLPSRIPQEEQNELFSGHQVVRLSALTGEGLDNLRDAIFNLAVSDQHETMSLYGAPNIRHKKALSDAVRFFELAAQSAQEDAPLEVIAMDLRAGLDAMGEITGETPSEEILGKIFDQFCIGK